MSTTAAPVFTALWLPKPGSARSDWEDGCGYSPSSGLFAVADGASTGTHSREWAFTLVQRWLADHPQRSSATDGDAWFWHWLDGVRSGFDPDDPTFRKSRAPAWVQSVGKGRGSHATFLGGRIGREELVASAVGDCCLFHLRAHERVATFPVSDVSGFGSSPALLTSTPIDDAALRRELRITSRPVEPGDVVFVASDAIAAWLMANIEDRAMWDALITIGPEGIERLCRDLYKERLLRSDDVTLLRVRVG